ncbi:hypothetical protein [Chryseobacterium sp. MFBS3-17]|uniref:hypothetical protein n=1 Tax=Chryseobacterium sp. MFBS3-17 TaxID=2886689 RepID=UPI001D0E7466|nr:hypothetical protein [Chryseobacterium sp. MFBS3-17]MCC2590250.1 hypothetical protein [Chryseobacterium sp. MFBS3-17]
MKEYLKQWKILRVVRLCAGLFILIAGIADREWLFIFTGAALTLLPLLNRNCCDTGACDTTAGKTDTANESITYNEIK